MHFHHYLLQRLSLALASTAQGQAIQACFSQSRNELVVALDDLYLRIGCNTPDTYVVPVEQFAKARKNVVNLFEPIYGAKLEGCRVVPQERELILMLSDGYDLILKLHGSMANVLLRKGGDIIDLFDHRHEADWAYQEKPGQLDEEALQTVETSSLRKLQQGLRQVSPIYDKPFAIRAQHFLQQDMDWPTAWQATLEEAQADQYWIIKEPQRMRLMLFPPVEGVAAQPIQRVMEALGYWLKVQFQYRHYREQHKFLRQALWQPMEKLQKIYDGYTDNVQQLRAQRDPEEIGHLLMANLHAIPVEAKQIEVEDLYQEGSLVIKLDPKLSAPDNAKRYYDKHKQRRQRLAYLEEQVADIEERLLQAEEEVAAFRDLVPPEELTFDERGLDVSAIKALKQLSRAAWKEQKAQEAERYPFRSFEREGFQIFVGRNARNNDELSFKFAHKNDLWLHAKDVTGSHVIIRQRPGKDLPISVLEYAAQLAAYYSKRKHDSLVPVQYTTRKYIRKRKGDPPGLVAVDREDVIMVEPVRDETGS